MPFRLAVPLVRVGAGTLGNRPAAFVVGGYCITLLVSRWLAGISARALAHGSALTLD